MWYVCCSFPLLQLANKNKFREFVLHPTGVDRHAVFGWNPYLSLEILHKSTYNFSLVIRPISLISIKCRHPPGYEIYMIEVCAYTYDVIMCKFGLHVHSVWIRVSFAILFSSSVSRVDVSWSLPTASSHVIRSNRSPVNVSAKCTSSAICRVACIVPATQQITNLFQPNKLLRFAWIVENMCYVCHVFMMLKYWLFT